MKILSRLEPWFFYATLACLLIPVWAVEFFVTMDGPCHLYNSKILLDWSDDVKNEFYFPFYFINHSFDPNRLYNLLTIPLLSLFKPQLAEKIFFTIYVVGFGFGFRYLIRQINPSSLFISSVGLLLCMHKLLMTGFLNNALSFMVWFWVAAWWWKKRNDFSLWLIIGQALLFLLLYSAHPIGLTFCAGMIGCLLIGLLFYERQQEGIENAKKLFAQRFQGLLLSALPTLTLFAEYIYRSDLSAQKIKSSAIESFKQIWNLDALITMDTAERIPTLLTSVFCLILFTTAVIIRARHRKLMAADGLALFIIAVIIVVIFPPHSITGGLEVAFRISIIPFIAILCWSATAQFPDYIRLSTQVIALALTITFVTVRLPIHQKASEYATEVMSVNSALRDTSTILVLNYDGAGKTPDGKEIANRIAMFSHVDCYLGTTRPLVISDNYETHFSYFPVQARWNTDMYGQTDKDGINFDHRPPRADILSYKRRTGQVIDFVLMLSYREEFATHPYTQEIFSQLDQAFDKVYTSSHQRAVLYQRRSGTE